MRTIDQLSDQLFLTDLVETAVYKEIQDELQKKYTMTDEDWPIEYYQELSDTLFELLYATANKAKKSN